MLRYLALFLPLVAHAMPPDNHFIQFGTSDKTTIELADPSCSTCQIIHYQYFDFSGNYIKKDISLHILPVALKIYPESRNIVANIYCSENPKKAWIDALTDSEYRKSISEIADKCKPHLNKVDINNDYYQSLGATGTPYFIDVKKD